MLKNHLVTNQHVIGDIQKYIYKNNELAFVELSYYLESERKPIKIESQVFLDSLIFCRHENSWDYAVLRIPELEIENIYNFELGNPDLLKVGDDIAFLGFPLGVEHLTCSYGIVSALYQSNNVDKIQLDANVNPGSSGSPLFRPDTGQVIGIVTRKRTGLEDKFEENKSILSEFAKQLHINSGLDFFVNDIDYPANLQDFKHIQLRLP